MNALSLHPSSRLAASYSMALLKQVPDILLPAETTSFPGDRVNPIRHMIRKSFRRNSHDTSPRLVVSSLSNGYKFLHLLDAAKTTGSPEHKTVVDLIQRNTSRRKPPTPHPEPTPEPPTKHLLTRHPNPKYDPDEWFATTKQPRFFYSPAERPRSAKELGGSGIRRVPHVATTACDYPFLRTKKPQPMSLGVSLWRRSQQKQRWRTLCIEFEGDAARLARLEDEWEDLVAGGPGLGAAADGGATFAKSIAESLLFLNRVEILDNMDKMYRAAALNEIEDRERELAKKEAAAREKAARGESKAGGVRGNMRFTPGEKKKDWSSGSASVRRVLCQELDRRTVPRYR
ncbi:uncharacterized protein PgNI_09171 [Pyricularia grisea]|uniref:37S ribosomal protein S25, mitochondrial n=1 Tax=Pyricularia grisea TaxID=148305 RepID=A0A6P8ASU6_PYRGI|nr:uncharacterized protein PgNI_09171 [Pyricularia grisea]TLD05196.1 hypothetical protein PgNI_09171 [Pyricularia grisea]